MHPKWQVKKVADVRRPEDTCVVTGVVVRKGLVHRKMRSYIEYPKVRDRRGRQPSWLG